MKPTSSKNNIDFIKSLSRRLVVDDANQLPEVVSDELGKAINELQVYQAELELQNEELRLVQGELESSRNKYYDLFNNAPTGYFLIDNNFSIIEANVAALDLLGVKRADIKDRPIMGYVRSTDHLRMNSLLQDIIVDKTKNHIIVQLKRMDNSFRTVKIDGQLSDEPESGVRQIMLTASDLTEQQKTQIALEESENLYRSLVQSSHDHIFMLSTDGYFLASNEQVAKHNLESSWQLIDKNVSDIYPDDSAASYIEQLQVVVSLRKAVQFEHQVIVDGKTRYYIDKLYPIVKDGRLWAVGGISHDVTAQRSIEEEKSRLEKQLRQSQKLESLGNLAGGIAHDFNNILSAILGFSELALGEVENGSSLEDDLKEIYRGGTRAKDLVKQILLFARQSRETIAPTSVATVAREVIKFLRSSIPSTIDIQTDIKSDSIILGNETQIHQIFMNLCTNAYQSMEPDGGTLRISIHDIELKENHAMNGLDAAVDKYIEIKIADDGHGIDPALLDYIFDPYFTTKQMGDGSGMGLAVVHSIVESCHGRISVESKPGQGSTFIILLPVTQDLIENSQTDAKDIPTGSESILLVDDEVSITKMGKLLLEKIGYSVTTSTRSIDAIEIFRKQSNEFDLVITDMTMPFLTGDKLAGELLRIRPDIPVILCTGYNRNVSPDEIEKIGIKAFASKPIVLSQFARTIRNVLDGDVK